MDIVSALKRIIPSNIDWDVGDTYESLVIKSEGYTKPTLKEVKASWEAYVVERDRNLYRNKRVLEYPQVGEQLDAILKQLNYMKMSGKMDLIQELDGVVGEWLAVKKKYPKE